MSHLFAYLTLFILVFYYSSNVINSVKPKLSVISPKNKKFTQINGKATIDVRSNSTLHLKCNGTQPIYWIFPVNDPDSTPIERMAKIKSTCIRNRKPLLCNSEAIIENINYRQTGDYVCHYSLNTTYVTIDIDNTASLYVFVNDATNLLVPVLGYDDFILVPLFKNETQFVIPCKPTNSRTTVTLHSVNPHSGLYQTDPQMIQFDPTVGFTITDFNSTDDYSAFDCKAKLGTRQQYSSVALHVIYSTQTYQELYPYIEVSSNVTNIGEDLSLNCFVHIPENIYVFLAWDIDSSNRRFIELDTISQRSQSKSGSYIIVSKMVIIMNTTVDDYGVYTCKVTDSGDNTYTVSKEIIPRGVTNARLPVNSSHNNIYHLNYFLNYVFLIYLLNLFQ